MHGHMNVKIALMKCNNSFVEENNDVSIED